MADSSPARSTSTCTSWLTRRWLAAVLLPYVTLRRMRNITRMRSLRSTRLWGRISQNGRFLRDFLYQGFNADEDGRIALDGVLAHVAGAGRGSFNYRFAQPSRDAQPTSSVFFPTDIPPFTDQPEKDPVTGAADGLLDRATAERVVPKIFFSIRPTNIGGGRQRSFTSALTEQRMRRFLTMFASITSPGSNISPGHFLRKKENRICSGKSRSRRSLSNTSGER